MTMTHTDLAERHGVELIKGLDATDLVPTVTTIARQGDVLVARMRPGKERGTVVPREGVAVVRGENGGNTHLLVCDGECFWKAAIVKRGSVALGTLTVPKDATAYLLHPQHGGTAFGPGTYRISRQREQADEVRLVAD